MYLPVIPLNPKQLNPGIGKKKNGKKYKHMDPGGGMSVK
jgi:hypothetical protein